MKDLPPEILELLFDYLNDPKDICNISETCKKFKEVIERSDRLVKKLTIYVSYPAILHSFRSTLKNSVRRYRNLCITRTRDIGTESQFLSLTNAFELIGPKIKNLTVKWCLLRNLDIPITNSSDQAFRRRIRAEMYYYDHAPMGRYYGSYGGMRDNYRDELHKEFITIIKYFTNLERTVWNDVHIERRTNLNEITTLDFTSLRQLEMRDCDAYAFDVISSATQLDSLIITDPSWNSNRLPGIDTFELFLISQEALKTLIINSIQHPRLFNIDRSERIQFKLKSLELKDVSFHDKTHAENFFNTQKELEFLNIQLQNERSRPLDFLSFYDEILKTVLKDNLKLKTLCFDKHNYRFINCDFLKNIKNENVETLNFNVSKEDNDAEFFKTLLKTLPNLKTITYKSEYCVDNDGDVCFDKGTNLDQVVQLVMINASVKSLINVYVQHLHTFELSPKLNGSYIDDYIGGFLHRHRTIKVFKIGNSIGPSYFFVSWNLCQIIVNYLINLESLTVYNFAEVNKSVQFLCNLRYLKKLTVSSLQYQQITAKTKEECERIKLKLIPVEKTSQVNEIVEQDDDDD
ncbi:uncharacterized protein [Chironomus tepperi]|uniref:uncharacterized protein n=1 Tax=Chironomus tepperi TaxID=113505 RepID=UPI00391FABF7